MELGEPAEAHAVTARLRELAERQEHPWGLATAARCGALASGRLRRGRGGGGALRGARPAPRRGPDPARPRPRPAAQRKWGAARDSLERAAAAFDALGSPGWAEQARAELARVGARRPTRERRADPDRAAGGRARGRRALEQGDRARSCSSPCTRSRRTSPTRTRSSASARAPSSRSASADRHASAATIPARSGTPSVS